MFLLHVVIEVIVGRLDAHVLGTGVGIQDSRQQCSLHPVPAVTVPKLGPHLGGYSSLIG